MTSQSVSKSDSQERLQRFLRGSILGIFALVMTVALTLILAFNVLRGPTVQVHLGEAATQQINAPFSITFVSDVLTQRAREQAAAGVPDQYTTVDLSIARAQTNLARSVFGFIEVVRADSMADEPTRLVYLRSVDGISIGADVAQDLLDLSPAEYAAARDNVLEIVQDTMRDGVVEDRLNEARRQAVLGADLDLSPAQERVVTALAPQFVVANIFRDDAARRELQEEAMSAVEPVSQSVLKDEVLLRVGDVVDSEDIEILEQLGLLRQQTDWQRLMSAFLASLLAMTVIAGYWRLYYHDQSDLARNLAILGGLILLFAVTAKLLVGTRTIYSYLYPAATLSILLAVVFDSRLSIVVGMAVGALVGYIALESLEMAVYAVAGGTIAVMTVRDTQRINALFRAGLIAALANMAVILTFRLPTNIGTGELLTLLLLGAVNGPILSAGLSLAGLYVVGSVFGVITPLQLQELSRLDHPLLQELLRRAPGTYHHSIWVANLAEQAAERVKANSPLVRVGAFFHDVGKINRPPFFTENQDGANPHDNLDPYSSARIIISHVPDGLALARRYKLPGRLRDFIAEHHGDRVMRPFYNKAVELAGPDEKVDVTRFQYKGPRPRTRETGIVQLADVIEATSSALRPNSVEAIEKLVTTIMDEHLREGQLDDSGLTLGDLKLIRDSFIRTVKGRFHTRISYPGNEELAEEAPLPPSVVAAPPVPPAAPPESLEQRAALDSGDSLEEMDELVRS